MLDWLLHLDYRLFTLINSDWTNSLFDFACPLLRNRYFWLPLYVFLFSFFIINFKRKGWLIIVFMIVSVACADQISSHVLKPAVKRIRPCNQEILAGKVRMLINCSNSYSFPSSHASNHFAAAFFLIVLFATKRKWLMILLILWASAISYSQVYVGLHFPVDILAGAVIGSLIGWAGGRFFLKYSEKLPFFESENMQV
jgi:membrane-associated phospholipid phosphatase